MRALAASGCVQVLAGIESLVFRHPGMGPKLAEFARIQDALCAIQDAGVAVIGCFIVGCDGETRQSLGRLAQFILASDLADVQLTLQTPFPGTALYRRLQDQGRLLPQRGWSYYTLFDVTFQPDLMGVDELETAFRDLVRQVFSPEPAAATAGDPPAGLAKKPEAAVMGIRTLLRYLIGDRSAILDIAASRRALWVGALFVLSAAFARDYDGEDLVHEPWYLVIPFGASILSSYFLFTFSYLKVSTPDRGPRSFLAAYRSFLILFWMTALLAWLYAIPYERLLTPAQATAANLWTLGLVAVWRVALMVRVVSVLMGYTAVRAFFLVMAFADVVALLAL